MKTIALISGGKDSCFNILHCIAQGHAVIALGNLYPEHQQDELDSHMFQTVGHDWVHVYASCLVHPDTKDTTLGGPELPLFRRALKRTSVCTQLEYQETSMDEVEDLYLLLKDALEHLPELQAVSVGAILSTYQRLRVEHVCQRLGLTSLAYLWEANQEKLLESMLACGLNAVVIKVASLGLNAQHLGKSIADLQPHLLKLSAEYGCNPCGEGGEYETITLDCPAFCKSLQLKECSPVSLSNDPYAPSAYLRIRRLETIPKSVSWDYATLRRELPSMLLPHFLEDLPRPPSFPNLPLALLRSFSPALFLPRSFTFKKVGHFFSVTGGVSHASQTDLVILIEDVFERLCAELESHGLGLQHLLFVQLGVNNMANFTKINEVYGRYFKHQPPARACVQLDIPHTLQLDALGALPVEQRFTLHVQSISYWAPANIGPYSQCAWQRSLGFIAGQIGLVPETMLFPSTNLSEQLYYALRHVHRISQTRLTLLVCVAYIVFNEHADYVRSVWQGYSKAPISIVVVPTLPRNALVELVPLGCPLSSTTQRETPQPSFDVQRDWTMTCLRNLTVCHLGISFKKDAEAESMRPAAMREVIVRYMEKLGCSMDHLLFTQVFFQCELSYSIELQNTFQPFSTSFIPCRSLDGNAQVLVLLLFVLTEKCTKL